jgi:hypothetical protein
MAIKELFKSEQIESLERSFNLGLSTNSDDIESLNKLYYKNNTQKTEANFGNNTQSKNWLEKARGVGKWIKKDVQESLEMMRNMINDPKQAFVDFGKDVNAIYNAIKLNKSSPEKELSELNLKKQLEPNPIFVNSKGERGNLGNQTHIMVERQKSNGRIKEKDGVPILEGRHVIGAETAINGGAYPGSNVDANGKYTREIIVVDTDRDAAFQAFYKQFVGKIESSDKRDIQSIINLYDKMITPMINLEKSEELATKYADQKVQLGMFLVEGGIVCRHSALLFAAIMERMQKFNMLPYKVDCSLRRHNGIWKGGQYGRHVYCSLKIDNKVFIVDPVQNESGDLDTVGKINPYAAEGDRSNPFKVDQPVKVLRNNNDLEAWSVKSIIRDPEDHINDMVVVVTIQKGIKLQKTVPLKTLLDWQNIA